MMPTVGRIVNYVYAAKDLDDNHKHLAGVVRPAIIVHVWDPAKHPAYQRNEVNLQVFPDALNDGFHPGQNPWKTSVPLADRTINALGELAPPADGTWHWPNRV